VRDQVSRRVEYNVALGSVETSQGIRTRSEESWLRRYYRVRTSEFPLTREHRLRWSGRLGHPALRTDVEPKLSQSICANILDLIKSNNHLRRKHVSLHEDGLAFHHLWVTELAPAAVERALVHGIEYRCLVYVTEPTVLGSPVPVLLVPDLRLGVEALTGGPFPRPTQQCLG